MEEIWRVELINQGRDWLDYVLALGPIFVGLAAVFVAWWQMKKASHGHSETIRLNNVQHEETIRENSKRHFDLLRAELILKQRQKLLERFEERVSFFVSKVLERRNLGRVKNQFGESVENARLIQNEANGAWCYIVTVLPHDFSGRDEVVDCLSKLRDETVKNDFSEEGEERVLEALNKTGIAIGKALTLEREEVEKLFNRDEKFR